MYSVQVRWSSGQKVGGRRLPKIFCYQRFSTVLDENICTFERTYSNLGDF